MKLLIIGDLHGRKPKIHFKDFDAIIQVGDVCEDRKISKYYKLWFQLLGTEGEDAPGVDELMLSDVGKEGIEKMEKESLERGREILKYLDSFGKPIFFVPGNWDQSYGPSRIKNIDKSIYHYRKAFYDWYLGDKVNPKLSRGIKNLKNCMYANFEFDNLNFVGYGLSSGTELLKYHGKKLDVTKKQLEILKNSLNKILNKLSSSYKKRNKRFPTIFITHNIPYNTKLDIVKDKKSYAYNKHLGSWVARKFVERYQPLLCVGGHVHEGKGKDKIGKTTLINPGFGKDAQVLVDIDEKKRKIRKIKFYGK